MPSWIAPNVTGALVRLLAGSLVALVFVFRCGDTQASTPTIPTDVRTTIAPPSVFVAMPSDLPSGATTLPGLEPTPMPEPNLDLTNAPVETAAPTPAPTPAPTTPAPSTSPVQTPTPTYAPSPAPIPTLPSTPSPTLTPSPTPTAPPTVAPTQAPTEQPTVSPTQQPSASPTQRSTASPTQRLNSPPQIERIDDQSGKVGQQFVIRVSANDPDGDKITLSCGGADKFSDNGDGTGTLEWTGTKPGKYAFTCSASDGKSSSSTAFAITVA